MTEGDLPLVVGWREWVRLPELLADDEPIKAKIDTGARTSSLHAWDVERFDRDGLAFARFSLHPRQHDDGFVVTAEAPVVDERDVRSSNGEVETRLVIRTSVRLGDRHWPIELTLTRRDEMGFRMLLGRTAMAGHIQVDPARSWLAGGRRGRRPR